MKAVFATVTVFTLFVLIAVLFISQNAYAESDVIELPNCSLKYSVETTADKSTIWRLWTDVSNWNKFDTLLEYSYLNGNADFVVGSTGYLKAKGAPKTKFELVEINEGVSFIESLKIPLWQTIELQRYFETDQNGNTVFTHEVNFKGPLRYLMYSILKRTFKKELKLVMGRLKNVAEEEGALQKQSN